MKKAAKEKESNKKNKKRIALAAGITISLLLSFYVLLVNFLVSAALVPSFMEKLEAFERITKDSYAAQVQTSDIKGNRQEALNETKEWLKDARHQKISVKTEDGYTLIAETFPAEGILDTKENLDTAEISGAEKVTEAGKAPSAKEGVDIESASGAEEESHKWVLLLHGYTGWKEEMYPFAYRIIRRASMWLCLICGARGKAKGILSVWAGRTILTVCCGLTTSFPKMKKPRLSSMASLWARQRP